MIQKSRILASLLASLLLAGSLASCATSSDDPSDAKVPEGSTATVENETEIKDNLPDDLNFGNDNVVFISRDIGMGLADEIYAESINSDPVNDAVYERNKTV